MPGWVVTPKMAKGAKAILAVDEKEWQQRFKDARRQIVYRAATEVLGDIRKRIGRAEPVYSRSLQVVSRGKDFAVWAQPVQVPSAQMDPLQTVVYVRPKSVSARVDPGVAVLEEFSPWTADTLPYWPRPSQAALVFRKARKNEVAQIARSRKAQEKLWRGRLREAGARLGRTKVSTRFGRLDVANLGMRLEFGVSASGRLGLARPHWRPALNRVQAEAGSWFAKDQEIRKTVTDVKNRDWRHRQYKTEGKISSSVAGTFRDFSSMLGY